MLLNEMAGQILVAGYAGAVKRFHTESSSRFGYCGKLGNRAFAEINARYEIGGSGYRLALSLKELESSPLLYSIVGSDSIAKQIIELLQSKKIDTSHIHQVKKRKSAIFIEVDSPEGMVQQYCLDELNMLVNGSGNSAKFLPPSIPAEIEIALISSGNTAVTQSIFAKCQKGISCTVWLAPHNLYQLGSDLLLQFLRSSHFLILNPFKEHQICSMLGLSAIDQLLDEEISMIVNILNREQSSQFRIFSKEKMPTYQISAPKKNDTLSATEIEENFAAGFVNALSEFKSPAEAVQSGADIACIDTINQDNKSPSTSKAQHKRDSSLVQQ